VIGLISEIKNLRAIKREIDNPSFVCQRVINESEILNVRKFCFKVYVRRGEIEPKFLNEQGVLGPDKDPYAKHSVYFVVRPKNSRQIIAASRLILSKPRVGVHSLQIDVKDLSKGIREFLESHDDSVAEPSSFAKLKGAPSIATTYLIREMLHYSLGHGIRKWLIALNPHIESTYRRRFGTALHRLGEKVTSKVDLDGRRPVNVPYLMDVQYALDNLEMGNAFYRHFVAPIIREFMHNSPPNDHNTIKRTPKHTASLSHRA